MAAIVTITVAVCASGVQAAVRGGTVNVGVIAPFTGNQANVGTFFGDACLAAVSVVNKAGGVVGNQMSCVNIDNTGDPADAEPNVAKALATTSNLDLAVGLDTATAAVTVPLIEHAHIPLITLNGLSAFDHQTNPFFWRVEPADAAEGAGLALWAVKHGEKRVALVFENTESALAVVPSIVSTIAKVHGKVLLNVTIPSNATSYSSVVSRVIAAKPQAILTDGTAQTEATFTSEYSQLNNGHVPPIITTTDLLFPGYTNVMRKVLGATFVPGHVTFMGYYFSNQPAALHQYVTALKSLFKPKDVAALLPLSGLPTEYDGVIIAALAMTAAKSTEGKIYNRWMLKVTTPGKGVTVVHTYAQGIAALAAGKRIAYVGVDGAMTWNKYHNVSGSFQAFRLRKSGHTVVAGTLSAQEVAKAER